MPITEHSIEPPAIKVLKPVFDRFQELISKRLDSIPVLMIGEDSIRYDFFYSLTEKLKLSPWDLQLEYPVHEESFIPRLDPKSKRKEKPQIDLIILTEKLNAAFEFGLFRRNRNPNGTINKTGRTLKMLNDFVRLGLHSYYTRHESFFVCVADSFMLKHRMDCKVYDAFPASKYYVAQSQIEQIKLAVKTVEHLDERFFKKAETIKLSITADLIYDSEIKADTLEHTTKILVWRIVTHIEN
jgi:hypothetical protein